MHIQADTSFHLNLIITILHKNEFVQCKIVLYVQQSTVCILLVIDYRLSKNRQTQQPSLHL
jgi:hypothetical protein